MAKRLYVGNLSYSATSEELQELFEQHGPVKSAQVLNDRETGRSRGFGFVEMEDDADADAAIEALDGQDHSGRRLTVNEAKPRTPGGGSAAVAAAIDPSQTEHPAPECPSSPGPFSALGRRTFPPSRRNQEIISRRIEFQESTTRTRGAMVRHA